MADKREGSYKERWEILEKIGEGGQGCVYSVRDKSESLSTAAIETSLAECIRHIATGVDHKGSKRKARNDLLVTLREVFRQDEAEHLGALKLLHQPGQGRSPDAAAARIAREIRAMSAISHPNLLDVLDVNEKEQWYVSRLCSHGTLDSASGFAADVPRALRAFRPLVAAVAALHETDLVHRDIKPQNIFMSEDDELLLGDFGLVFFLDEEHTRISGTFENVGSRDWMPPWAQGRSVEDVRPSFDVFSLGKVLWSMIAGVPILQLWYFEKPAYDVELMHPECDYITLVNPILRRCVVENEKDCLSDASALLAEVDKAVAIMDVGADHISSKARPRKCRVCGGGCYKLVADRDHPTAAHNFGFNLGRNEWKIFACEHCGHVQLFAFKCGINPTAWNDV